MEMPGAPPKQPSRKEIVPHLLAAVNGPVLAVGPLLGSVDYRCKPNRRLAGGPHPDRGGWPV